MVEVGDGGVPVARTRAAKRAKASSGSAGTQNEKRGSALGTPPPAPVRPESSAVPGDVTVDDTDALDCGVCFLPLKPPIFQCDVGHVVCSPCRDKLKATGKCHICGVATGGYRRCHAMELLVESIHVPCPNAAHGCTVRPAYYDKHNHRQTCGHAPYHCPGEACDFIGSTAVLLDHFSSVHSWPCTTKVRAGKKCSGLQDWCNLFREYFNIRLQDGFNFVLADHAADIQGAATSASIQYLFLLNVVRQPLGRAISVLCIHPHATAASGDGQGPSSKEMKCELSYTRYEYGNSRSQLNDHYQRSVFRVACTDLSSGLPSPDGCFQFVVLDSVLAGSDKDAILVNSRFVIG